MFTITKKHDENIQDKSYAQYELFELAIDYQFVFSTEDINTLKKIADDESTDSSWLIGADRNSKEQAELSQLRITKSGDLLIFEVQKIASSEFESAGGTTFAEFTTAMNSL